MRLFLLALVLGATLSLPAQVTTFRFNGTVASVGSNLGSDVQVGDTYQADFTFDPAVATQFNFGNFAVYRSILSEIRIFTGSGTLTWTASDPLSDDVNNGFTIDNSNNGRDAITFSTGPGQLVGPALNGEAVGSHNFTLQDNRQTAFANSNIPTFLNPASFGTKALRLTFDGNLEADTINFSLSSIDLNPTAIPEPSTYALLAGGLALAGRLVAPPAPVQGMRRSIAHASPPCRR